MGLGDLFKKLTSKGDEHQVIDNLSKALAPLDIINKGLAARAQSYVVNGDHIDVLLELERHPYHDAAVLLGKPGTLTWWWPSQLSTDKLADTHKTTIKAASQSRSLVYQHAGVQLGAEPLVRLGKLLSAACKNANITRTTDALPEWFLYLIHDGLYSSFEDTGKLNTLEARPGWSVAFLQSLLAVDEIAPERVLPAIFDRKDVESYYVDRLSNLLSLPDLKDYLYDHPAWVEALPAQLSSDGTITLLRALGQDERLKDFYTALLVKLALHSGKGIRTEADRQLGTIDSSQSSKKMDALIALFKAGSNPERVRATELLARSGAAARPLLAEALAHETAKTVQQALQQALARIDTEAGAQTAPQADIPPFTPYPEVSLGESALQLLLNNHRVKLEETREGMEAELALNREMRVAMNWQKQLYQRWVKISEQDIEQVLAIINGQRAGKFHIDAYQFLAYDNALIKLPEFNIMHAIRIVQGLSKERYFAFHVLRQWCSEPVLRQLDLRSFADALKRAGHPEPERQIATLCFTSNWDRGFLDYLEPDQIWPFFVDHLDFIKEALGLIPSQAERYREFTPAQGLAVLATFPVLPAALLPALLELALGDSKTYRNEVQSILAKLPDVRTHAEGALAHSKSEIRITAAEWLAEIGDAASIPALTSTLKQEKRETVRAALLTTLEKLGGDISAYLSPAILLKEAEKGLGAKPPASLAWFNFAALPTAVWADGSPVDPKIIQWWVILACKLKEPASNGLLNRYITLLSRDSQAQLGSYILYSFIAQDTRHPTESEADTIAQAEAPARLQMCLGWYKSYPDYYGNYKEYTLEKAYADIKRERLAVYLGSAIADKGILALTWATTGHVLVSTLQQYMKEHYQRRSQIEAMLMAAANSDDPVIIQLLLSISRRYRTASVQLKARELVQVIADRNGWSRDELADRTIPTAGFDETGILTLYYGERIYTARMDQGFKIVLRSPEGKEIKALPEARKTDDPELIKEAKTQFGSSKKELKQVVDLQTQRLYEAMCAGRQWPVAEWRAYLLAHPIMNRLLQQLVWEEVKGDQALQTFRPTEDGSLINLDDDEVELAESSMIRLTHAAILAPEVAAAWLKHFKDYKVKPLFTQMTHRLPDLAEIKDANDPAAIASPTAIENRQGWVTDTFTFRGAMTKRGYQRAQAEDGGCFFSYFKEFNSLGVSVNVDFTGNSLPEENRPAVLYGLSFESTVGKSWNRRQLNLVDVPPILLAEAYADYHAVAAACVGYDPEWKKKSPW
jgi:HEAT repeat protein